MKLETLIEQFSHFPFAAVGHGPKHPTSARPELKDALSECLRIFPYLSPFDDYVRFLELYSGAAIVCPADVEDWHSLMIYGIGEFDDPCANPLDADGFHIFSTALGKPAKTEQAEHVFAFDAKGQNGPGVYRKVSLAQSGTFGPFELHSSSFLTWLEEVVRCHGRLV